MLSNKPNLSVYIYTYCTYKPSGNLVSHHLHSRHLKSYSIPSCAYVIHYSWARPYFLFPRAAPFMIILVRYGAINHVQMEWRMEGWNRIARSNRIKGLSMQRKGVICHLDHSSCMKTTLSTPIWRLSGLADHIILKYKVATYRYSLSIYCFIGSNISTPRHACLPCRQTAESHMSSNLLLEIANP